MAVVLEPVLATVSTERGEVAEVYYIKPAFEVLAQCSG